MPKYTAHITERRTGKTSLAVQYTKTLDNAMLVVFNNHMARYIMENHNLPERKIFVLQHKHHVHHLKYFRTIIFDEPSFIKGEWQEEVLEDLLRANCNIIAFGSLTASGSNYILNKVKELQVKQEYNMSTTITIDDQDYLVLGYETAGSIKDGTLLLYRCGVEAFKESDRENYSGDYLVLEKLKWKPKDREDYYMIDSTMSVISTFANGPSASFDKARLEVGNCFKTREEAEEVRDKMLELLGG